MRSSETRPWRATRAIAIVLIVIGAAACWHIPGYRGSATGDGNIGDGNTGDGDGGIDTPDAPDVGNAPRVMVMITDSELCSLAEGTLPQGTPIPVGCVVAIVAPDYTLTFDANKWRLPESLAFNSGLGVEALATGGTSLDDYMGFTINGSGSNIDPIDEGVASTLTEAEGSGSAMLTIEEAGPAAAQIVVMGSAMMTKCGGSANWSATFTAYPDGRLVRYDQMTADTTSCTLVTSFAAIGYSEDNGGSNAFGEFTLNHFEITSQASSMAAFASSTACFANGSETQIGPHIAIGSIGSSDNSQYTETAFSNVGGAVLLENAWVYPPTNPGSISESGTTFWQIDAEHSCNSGLPTAAYSLPAPSTGSADFKFGWYGLEIASGTTTLAPPSGESLPAGFVVNISGASTAPTIYRDTGTTRELVANVDYQIETVGLDYVVWFRDGLQMGEDLRFVEP